MSDADLKVASAALDADGSGSVSFSEFYAWFAGRGGVSDAEDGLHLLSDDGSWSTGQRSDYYGQMTPPFTGRTERSRLGAPPSSVASAGGRSMAAGRKRGPRNAARTTFVKVLLARFHGIAWHYLLGSGCLQICGQKGKVFHRRSAPVPRG